MKKDTPTLNRRGFLKAAGAVGIAATAPMFFIRGAYADDKVGYQLKQGQPFDIL